MAVQFPSQNTTLYTPQTTPSAGSSANSDESIFTSGSSDSSGDLSMMSVFNYSSDKTSDAKKKVEEAQKKKAQLEKEVKKIENQIAKEENESKISDLKVKLYGLQSKLRTAANNVSSAVSNFKRAERSGKEESSPSFNIGEAIVDGIKAVGGAIVDGVKAVGGAIANSLASAAEKVGLTRNTTGMCYGGVKDSLLQAGLINSKGEMSGVTGGMSAYEAADILAKNNKFTEVSSQYANAEDLRSLPQGAVVVWNRGVGNLSKEHGHISIALGDGRESSDHIQKQIVVSGATAGNSYRVFLPT